MIFPPETVRTSTADGVEVGTTHTTALLDFPTTRISVPAGIQQPSHACQRPSARTFCAAEGVATVTASIVAAANLIMEFIRAYMVAILSESDEKTDTCGYAGQVDAVKAREIVARRCTAHKVARLSPECPARTRRPLDAGENLAHGRPATGMKRIREDGQRGVVHEIALLAEIVVHHADAGTDVGNDAVRHPRVVSDLAAALRQVIARVHRQGGALKARGLLDRQVVVVHEIPEFGVRALSGRGEVEYEVNPRSDREREVCAQFEGVERTVVHGQVARRERKEIAIGTRHRETAAKRPTAAGALKAESVPRALRHHRPDDRKHRGDDRGKNRCKNRGAYWDLHKASCNWMHFILHYSKTSRSRERL